MSPLVLRIRGEVAELVRTLVTLERPEVFVDALVRRQAGPLHEVFVALCAPILAAGFRIVSSQMGT